MNLYTFIIMLQNLKPSQVLNCEKIQKIGPVTTTTTTSQAKPESQITENLNSITPSLPPSQQDCEDSCLLDIESSSSIIISKALSPKSGDRKPEEESLKSTSPKQRYISSYLNANKSFIGSVVLTSAQRKEYPVEIVTPHLAGDNSRCSSNSSEDSESDSDSDDGSKLIVDEKPLVPEDQPLSLRVRSTPPSEEQRPSPPPPPEPAVRCSVIQRTPSAASCVQRPHEVLLPLTSLEHLGPEQQEPIDYHVPRRRSSFDSDDEQVLNAKRLERERKSREARRRSALLAARAILAQARLNPRSFVRSLPGILAAAAGHGRTTSGSNGGGQGQSFQGGFNSNSGTGNGQAPSGGSPTGFGGTSGLGGGTGGGMGGGRDGRGNYGPNSPPSGALPPFYESLKSGQTMNGSSTTNFNGSPNTSSTSPSATSNFLLQNAAAYLMSATGGAGSSGSSQPYSGSGGDNVGGSNGCGVDNSNVFAAFANGHSNGTSYNPLSYSTKYNNHHPSSFPCSASTQHLAHHLPYGGNPSAYGIVLKDEPDIEYDEAKIDIGAFAQNIIQATMGNSGNFNASAYEDAIMSDLASVAQGPNGTVDPLQFTATLMLSSQTDHLLEQLSDAVDLSSFLQRSCVDDENSTSPREEFELVSTPSLTPDSISITPVDCHNQTGTQIDSFHENLMQQLTHNMTRPQLQQQEQHQQQQQQQQQANSSYGSFEREVQHNGGSIHHSTQQQQQQQQQQPPPSYQHATRDLMHIQHHQQQQQQQQQHANNSYHQQQQSMNPIITHASLLLNQTQQQQQHNQQNNGYHHASSLHSSYNGGQQSHHHNQHHHTHANQLHHYHLNTATGGQQQHHGNQHNHQNPNHPNHHHSDNSNLSLPSPNGANTGHIMVAGHHPMSSAASNSSGTSNSGLLDSSLLDAKPIIQSLGLPPEVQLEFVNGGHGIKNPLAMYVCEECGHTTCEPEVHYLHLKENHPYSPALLKFYDKRHFKFTNSQFANNLLGQLPMPVHN
uniref:Uncharacterized protein n=1 Tax=Glossina brevipalpis TaxID=37001 RepID=A0A1A9WFA2_9MUSC